MSSIFDSAYFESRDALYRFALGMVNDEDEAKDILHDGYEKVKLKLNEGQKLLNLRSYLFMTIRNLCFDSIRKRSRFNEIDKVDEPWSDSDYTNLEKSDEVGLVRELLQKLPETQRSVIILKDIEDYDYEEVSKIMGMDLNNVRVNLSLARKKVRQLFQEIKEYETRRK